jgi:hypothetical protein
MSGECTYGSESGEQVSEGGLSTARKAIDEATKTMNLRNPGACCILCLPPFDALELRAWECLSTTQGNEAERGEDRMKKRHLEVDDESDSRASPTCFT